MVLAQHQDAPGAHCVGVVRQMMRTFHNYALIKYRLPAHLVYGAGWREAYNRALTYRMNVSGINVNAGHMAAYAMAGW